MEIKKEEQNAIVEFAQTYTWLKFNFKVMEKTLDEWMDHFHINLPIDTDLLGVQKALMQSSRLLQECSDLYSQLNFGTMYVEMSYNEAVDKKRAEAISLAKTNTKANSIAKAEYTKTKMTLDVGKMVREFFEEQLRKIKTVTKNLETIANSQMSELKNLNKQKYIDAQQ